MQFCNLVSLVQSRSSLKSALFGCSKSNTGNVFSCIGSPCCLSLAPLFLFFPPPSYSASWGSEWAAQRSRFGLHGFFPAAIVTVMNNDRLYETRGLRRECQQQQQRPSRSAATKDRVNKKKKEKGFRLRCMLWRRQTVKRYALIAGMGGGRQSELHNVSKRCTVYIDWNETSA
jgi:hypothetical protein